MLDRAFELEELRVRVRTEAAAQADSTLLGQ